MNNRKNAALQILVFGALWGTAEASLGAGLHILHVPYKGAVMANIGFAIMAAGTASSGLRFAPLCMGMVAVSLKLLDALILEIPLHARLVLNPAAAIVLESLMFQGVALLFRQGRRLSWWRSALIGVSGMYLSSLSSALFFFYAFSRGPLFSGTPGEALIFVLHHGSVAAMISAVLTPTAFLGGKRLRVTLESLSPKSTRAYRLSIAAFLAACLAAIFVHPFT
jgi:hypothetical protein